MTKSVSARRRHDRASFFKYYPLSTALRVIETCSLRWSAPTRFNDPFDVQREATVGFSLSALRAACDREYIRLIETDGVTAHPKIRQMQDMLRAQPDERSALIQEYLATQLIEDPPSPDAFEMLADIWRTQSAELRIVCLSEANDSASMWDRYADGHRGVVLELACDDATDSAFLLARPVEYREEPPSLPDVEWWAKAITCQPIVDLAGIWSEYFYVKKPDWSPEREWRVVTYAGQDETGDFSDYPLSPHNILSVYVGYKASESEVTTLLAALGRTHQHVVVYQAALNRLAGRIEFARR